MGVYGNNPSGVAFPALRPWQRHRHARFNTSPDDAVYIHDPRDCPIQGNAGPEDSTPCGTPAGRSRNPYAGIYSRRQKSTLVAPSRQELIPDREK